MLKVLVADDEAMQREGLRTCVRWDELGLELIGAVPNAEAALKISARGAPDILITDVRMPGASGLELAAKLKEQNPRLETVVISGYDEFEYAREAIRLQARAYILKPFGSAKMEEVLREIVGYLQRQEERCREETILRRQMQKALPLLRERFLVDLCLVGRAEPEASRHALFLGLPAEAVMSVAILGVEPVAPDGLDDETCQLALLRLRRLIKKHFPPQALGICAQQGDRSLWLLLFLPAVDDYTPEVAAWIDAVRSSLTACTGYGLTAGVGDAAAGWEGIRRSYLEARRAFRHRLVLGAGQTIFARDLAENRKPLLLDVGVYSERLLETVRNGAVEEIPTAVGEIFAAIGEERSLTLQYLRSVCLELLAASRRVLHEEGASLTAEVFSPENLDHLMRLETIPSLCIWLTEIVSTMAETLARRRRHRSAALADRVRTYIREHYAEDISIHDAARAVYLTPNYLGTIFRLEQGETFTDYLNRVRIEEAKGLFRTRPYLRVYQVAELIGFKNVGYFSNKFRRLVGVPPGEYRAAAGNETAPTPLVLEATRGDRSVS